MFYGLFKKINYEQQTKNSTETLMQLFFSDLHLSPERPDNTALFLDCLKKAGEEAVEVFILGDLFDFWAGDDDMRNPAGDVKKALRRLSEKKTKLYIASGNRDFLLGPKFATETGATLLPDYQVIDLNGERTLITHGDILCTRDKSYQRFRRLVRNKAIQKVFLSLPLSVRLIIASNTKSQTLKSIQKKPMSIMDVDLQEVSRLMTITETTLLIHGHTHRPKIHKTTLKNKRKRRIVLGDWHEENHYIFLSHSDDQQLLRADKYLEYFKP